MQDGFYLADETHKSITGELVKYADVLYFRQARSGFDGKADKDHVKNYAALFGEFMKSHPDYKLPEKFAKEEIGQPSTEVKPQAEIPSEKLPVSDDTLENSTDAHLGGE